MPKRSEKGSGDFDVVVVSGAGIDTNIYLSGGDIDFAVEANFTQNIDYLGQAGGYSSRGFTQLGKRVALIDVVGDDYHGEFIRRQLERDGIDISAVETHPSGTRRSVNFMYADGRRKNFYDAKGAREIVFDIPRCRNILSRTRLAHFNIINFSRHLLPVAKELGVTVSCDLQDVVSPDDAYRADYIRHADILFFSSVNHPDPRPVMETFFRQSPASIIVCGMGADGCGVGTRDGFARFPPLDLFGPVVDTNGAGDALAVGFLCSYFMDGFSIEDSALRGQIAARFTCTIKASSSHLISRRVLDEAYDACRKLREGD